VFKNLIDFLKYNTVKKVYVINELEAEFPTISFCIPFSNTTIDKSFLKVRFDRIDGTYPKKIFKKNSMILYLANV